MMRDCAGLDSSDDEEAELVSVGPGDGGSASSSLAAAVVVMGNEDSLRLCASPDLMVPLLLPPRFRVV